MAIIRRAVFNNDSRITLTPDILYQNNNGVIDIVPAPTVTDLLTKTPDVVAPLVSSGNYLYTPFHYVLDATNDDFTVRPYYLDSKKHIAF